MAESNRGADQNPPAADALTSRRTFLSTAAAAGVGAVVTGWCRSGSVEAAQPDPSSGWAGTAAPHWQLEAVRVEQTFADGTIVPFFRFQSLAGTPTNGGLPLLRATERRLATLTVHNQLDIAIRPDIVGGRRGRVIPPGRTGHMRFRAPRAGTWLLTDGMLGRAAGPVGLGAVLVSEPWQGALHPRQPFDREYVLLYQDADDRWNHDIDAGMGPDSNVYEPNYHTVNGLTFPQLAEDPDSRIVCHVGDRVLLRLGNLGHVRHSIHFHGYHAQIVAYDNAAERMLPMKDTIPLPAYTTAEVILPVNQPGVYPLHPHSLTTVTDNGFYPYGQIVLIDAT